MAPNLSQLCATMRSNYRDQDGKERYEVDGFPAGQQAVCSHVQIRSDCSP